MKNRTKQQQQQNDPGAKYSVHDKTSYLDFPYTFRVIWFGEKINCKKATKLNNEKSPIW